MGDGTMVMPFGTHKGKTLEEIPSDYLKWMYKDFTDKEDLALAAEEEYDFREKHNTHFWS